MKVVSIKTDGRFDQSKSTWVFLIKSTYSVHTTSGTHDAGRRVSSGTDFSGRGRGKRVQVIGAYDIPGAYDKIVVHK